MREDLARSHLEAAQAALAAAKDALRPRPSGDTALAIASAMLRDLRVRDRCFPAGMFRDYRWQALLILFIADAEQRDVRFLDLFTEIGAPHTTGKRIVDELEQLRFVAVRPGDYARSRKLVRLTETGVAQLENYFQSRSQAT